MSEVNRLNGKTVLVIGAGIMGAGIAQVAAQAGHPVLLYDANPAVPEQARAKLTATFDKLVSKGKFTADEVATIMARIQPVSELQAAANAALVVEAIIENLDIKRSVFAELESIVSKDCILATNTSSISVTAIANGLQHPERLVGMHFFNPVPLMKLVEVVSGLQTDKAVAEAIYQLSAHWGKVPVYAKSTPGFIVNRIARPFYAETLALLQEQAAQPVVLDACLKAVGFRMGPCELMDLIGHDTNFSVTRSVYEANFYDKRFVPSLVQQELVDGGLLGRKSGQGFYDYRDGAVQPLLSEYVRPDTVPEGDVIVLGSGPVADLLAARLQQAGVKFDRARQSDEVGVQLPDLTLCLTDGRVAAVHPGGDVVVFDLPLNDTEGAVLAYAVAGHAPEGLADSAAFWLRVLGFNPQRLADVPGLVVARTLAMLINEAADAVHQGVCSVADANAAMKMGVNYPKGPLEWMDDWDIQAVNTLVDTLDDWYCGERYRVSPWLRQQALAAEFTGRDSE
ncbi:MAG: 3-hydroxyacyl-CoA dehydrogenase [Thiolinea sp.]